MEIKTKDIVALLELNKRKAELEFKMMMVESAGADGKTLEGLKAQHGKAMAQAEELQKKIKDGGVEVILPHGRKIAEFNGELRQLSPAQIIEAMRKRDGEAYGLLAGRGELIKSNFENRANIAKISILVAGLDGERKMKLFEAAFRGCVSERIDLKDWEDSKRRMLAKLLSRTGVKAGISDGFLSADAKGEEDIALQLMDRKVWVSGTISRELEDNLRRIKNLNPSIQLKTAERQIRTFSEEEEREFAILQEAYLRLLKEQDELLREFDEEESVTHCG